MLDTRTIIVTLLAAVIFLLAGCTQTGSLPEEARSDLSIALPSSSSLESADYSPFPVTVKNDAGIPAPLVQTKVSVNGEEVARQQLNLISPGSSQDVDVSEKDFVRAACDEIGEQTAVNVSVKATSLGDDQRPENNEVVETYEVACARDPWRDVDGRDLVDEPTTHLFSDTQDPSYPYGVRGPRVDLRTWSSVYVEENLAESFTQELGSELGEYRDRVPVYYTASQSAYRPADGEQARIDQNYAANLAECYVSTVREELDNAGDLNALYDARIATQPQKDLRSLLEDLFPDKPEAVTEGLRNCVENGELLPEIRHDESTKPVGDEYAMAVNASIQSFEGSSWDNNREFVTEAIYSERSARDVARTIVEMALQQPLVIYPWGFQEPGEIRTGKVASVSRSEGEITYTFERGNTSVFGQVEDGETNSHPLFDFNVSAQIENEYSSQLVLTPTPGEEEDRRCTIEDPFDCRDIGYADNTLYLALGTDRSDGVTGISVEATSGQTTASCTSSDVDIPAGSTRLFSCDIPDVPPEQPYIGELSVESLDGEPYTPSGYLDGDDSGEASGRFGFQTAEADSVALQAGDVIQDASITLERIGKSSAVLATPSGRPNQVVEVGETERVEDLSITIRDIVYSDGESVAIVSAEEEQQG